MSASNREYRKQVQQIQTDHAEQQQLDNQRIEQMNALINGRDQAASQTMETINQANQQRKQHGEYRRASFRHNEINN